MNQDNIIINITNKRNAENKINVFSKNDNSLKIIIFIDTNKNNNNISTLIEKIINNINIYSQYNYLSDVFANLLSEMHEMYNNINICMLVIINNNLHIFSFGLVECWIYSNLVWKQLNYNHEYEKINHNILFNKEYDYFHYMVSEYDVLFVSNTYFSNLINIKDIEINYDILDFEFKIDKLENIKSYGFGVIYV